MPRTHSLQGFFGFVEQRGGGTFARPLVEQELGDGVEGQEILRALMRAEVVTKARYAVRIACPEGRTDCEGHGVEEHFDTGRGTLKGVCTARRRKCASVDIVDEAPLARVTVSLADVGRALRRLFGFDGACALEQPNVLTLGEEEIAGKNPRDALFLPRPDYAGLPAALKDLGRARRATLALIPTGGPDAPALRAAFPPGAHVEVCILSERVGLRDGQLAFLSANPPQVRSSPTSAPLTLVLDCVRRPRGMIITANGAEVDLPDKLFALLIKLVDVHLKGEGSWSAFAKLDIDRRHVWKTNRLFAPLVPKRFNVIALDRKEQCRLNPHIVVERVSWQSVAAYPGGDVKKLAERYLSSP